MNPSPKPEPRHRPKRRKRTLSSLKRELWKIVSQYIRLRDSILTTGTKYEGLCISCGVKKLIENADAGHFISRTNKVLCYDERNVHLQCKRCNGYLKGNFAGYYNGLKARYGDGFANLLLDISEETKGKPNQWKAFEIEELLETYKQKFSKLQDTP